MNREWWSSENPLWGQLAVWFLIVWIVLMLVGGWYFRPGPKQPERLKRWHL